MLQNRVDPFGNLIKTKARGKFLGNRGQLHGKGKEILRPFKHKAWISCLLEFKNRHREIMAPNLWTELFFLDEVTALAAGHRPCFECRRADALEFKKAWLKGNPEYNFTIKTSINTIDEILHRERISVNGQKITFTTSIAKLPHGTFFSFDEKPYLISKEGIRQWTPSGYGDPLIISGATVVQILTPKSIVNALSQGYMPKI